MEGRLVGKPYLGWSDIAEMFGCGRSKAMLIMHEVGVVHVGRSAFVRMFDLDAYLAEHGGTKPLTKNVSIPLACRS